MAEYARYGDIAGVILDEWEQDKEAFGRANLQGPTEEEQRAFTEAIPALTAGAAQVATQAIPGMRAMGSLGRGAATLASGAFGAAGGERLRQGIEGEQIDYDKIAGAGLENLAFDVGGNVVFRYGGKLVKIPYTKVRQYLNKGYGEPVEGTVDEAAVAAQKWLQERNKQATLTQYQAQPTKVTALQEGIARASVLSGSVLKEVDETALNVIRNEVDTLTSQAGQMTREEFGDQFKLIVDAGEEALAKWAGPRYTAIDNLGYGVKVDLRGVKAQAQASLKNLEDIAAVPENQSFLRQQVLGIPTDTLTFAQARQKLSDLKAFQRSLEASDPRQKVVRDAIAGIEGSMEASARKGGKEVYTFYRQVNEEFKSMSQALRSDIILEALSKNPERVGEYFFRNGNVTEIKSAYRALQQIASRDPSLKPAVGEMVENFQQAYIRGIFGSIKDEASLKAAIKTAEEQRETLQAVLGGAEKFEGVKPKTAAIEAMLNAMDYSSRRPDSVMSLFIASKEAGGIESVVRGSVAAGASIVAALPTIMSRAAGDPKRVAELLKINRTSMRVGFTDQVASKLIQLAKDLGINPSDFIETGEIEPASTTQQPPQAPVTQEPDISDILQSVR